MLESQNEEEKGWALGRETRTYPVDTRPHETLRVDARNRAETSHDDARDSVKQSIQNLIDSI